MALNSSKQIVATSIETLGTQKLGWTIKKPSQEVDNIEKGSALIFTRLLPCSSKLSSRSWDKTTSESLDKDIFRFDKGVSWLLIEMWPRG